MTHDERIKVCSLILGEITRIVRD